MTYTFVPKEDAAASRAVEGETPFEAMQRRLAEKRKARKQAKKLLKAGGGAGGGRPGAEKDDADAARAAPAAELELLLADDDGAEERGYNMRALLQAEKERGKGNKAKKRSKKKKGAANDEEQNDPGFAVDVTDDRFSALWKGDSRFGIDRTSTEYKETKAMKQILKTQRKRREREGSADDDADAAGKAPNAGPSLSDLAGKLKRKIGADGAAASRKKAK